MSLIKSFFSKVIGSQPGAPRYPEACRVLPGLLSAEDLLAELARERDRSDRSGRPFSLVAFEVKGSQSAAWLAGFLHRRLRSIDRPGWLRDKLCVLLPETPAQGAWKLTEDICRESTTGSLVGCEVFSYPCEDEVGNLSGVFAAHSTVLSSSKSKAG